MRLPKKISPDSLVDAIIEVKYEANRPFEVLLGIFFEALDETYFYTNRPIKPAAPGTFIAGTISLFYNDKISIQVFPGALAFSSLNKYIGWEDYYPAIEKALNTLHSTGNIAKFTRVGIRYITEYVNKDLKDSIKFEFSFGWPEISSLLTTFRTEFMYSESKVILTLHNKLPVLKQLAVNAQPEIVLTSIIDIDVIKEPLSIEKLTEIHEVINNGHQKVKEVFFGMLREDFLKTLNPEY